MRPTARDRDERSLYKSSEEAKRDYFLTPEDLAQIYSFKEGGWGNNTRLFRRSDLLRFAIEKHGQEGLRKKFDARAKREATKRAREAEAAAAAAALFGGGGGGGGGAPPSPQGSVVELDAEGAVVATGSKKPRTAGAFSGAGAAAPAAAAPPPPPPPAVTAEDRAAALRLVAEARRGFKAKLTWDYLRSKNAEHGALATVTLERVEQRVFAVVIGRGADPGLRSLAKNGAWFRAELDAESVFDGPVAGSGGRFNCNAQLALGGEEFETLTFKYRPSTQTMTVTGFVNPRGF
jgi:hypothetical protein